MTTALSIIETAYRATLEEQDDTVIWLTHMLRKNGIDVSILLRSNAVNYVVDGQDASGLSFGGAVLSHPPSVAADLQALIELGVSVSYVHEDLIDRGIAEGNLIRGVKAVPRAELPRMLVAFDHVWHW